MKKISKKNLVYSSLAMLFSALFFFSIFYFLKPNSPQTLENILSDYQNSGKETLQNFNSIPTLTPKKTNDGFEITDDVASGIQVTYANKTENPEDLPKEETKVNFPNTYDKPIDINLPGGRKISIVDKNSQNWKGTLISKNNQTEKNKEENSNQDINLAQIKEDPSLIKYESNDQRKTIIYGYQKDGASGETKIKNWITYKTGNGIEEEKYQIQNAKVKIDDSGNAQLFFDDGKEAQNQQAMADVPQGLMERAQKAIMEDVGTDILNPNKAPDIIIPYPYYIDKDGNMIELKWNLDEKENTISVKIETKKESYPIALDPTLSFKVPGQSNTAGVIEGEAGSSFGIAMTAGDFNADGKTDLAIGAYSYSTSTGRVYIFYNKGYITATATAADVVITGETAINYFGYAMTSGDFNGDGKTDLAVGSYYYSSGAGRVYIFYNDGLYPTTALTADVVITGEAGSEFGYSMTSGDFNADGKTDLAIGTFVNPGRAYIFYNDGSIPTTAITADVIITGEAGSNFGMSMTSGDFNADGKTDLAVGARAYSANIGRAYIFYNDGSIPTTAITADVIITGESLSNYFGYALTSGDFNADGKTDLAIGAYGYSANTGRVYIFYNDGSIPTTAATADTIITGETTNNYFGVSLISGDFNGDGKTDLAIGANYYSTNTGRSYIFYNDGSIPTTAATADVIITGEATNNNFGYSMASGDFNGDGKIDLAIGAHGYNSTGRTYIFYSQNGQVNTNKQITGEVASSFGVSMASGDFNADGRIDLAVGASGYSTNTGRAYIFYNDGSIPITAATADVTITGEAASDYFGNLLISGDFNADGKTDLAVTAWGYSLNTGRAYIFYNDGSIPTTATTADVIITGEAGSRFGWGMTSGDFNGDGKIDLAVGAIWCDSYSGRAYLFYNDGSYPTTAAAADYFIDQGPAYYYFGRFMTSGDFNADGKTDLAVVGSNNVYIFYCDGSIPNTAETADVIITGGANTSFGWSMTSGDFNADGKTDLAVGASYYSTSTGRVFIFYNDGAYPATADTADLIIEGEASKIQFGSSLISGDFNADGKTDLAIGTNWSINSSGSGKVYIFYNDGSIPTTAATADVVITSEESGKSFGFSLVGGDFNTDGKIDLAISAENSASTNAVYIYETRDSYAWNLQKTGPIAPRIQGGIGQEIGIVGDTGSSFGNSIITGDFNADGRTDLAVGSNAYSSNTGRVYIFYNDGSISNTATSADVIITGEAGSQFGYIMTSGDFNADGRTDLAVGSNTYSSNTGRVYIFYNDGSMPAVANNADAIITGETNDDLFGSSITSGDFNSDGRTDLAVGATGYAGFSGRAYIFYNDGSIPTTATTADVIINGGASTNYLFGSCMTSGDFNSDGRIDLAVGARYFAGFSQMYVGKALIFYNDGAYPANVDTADVTITGGSNEFFAFEKNSIASGDFNGDGRTDLAVGAKGLGFGKVHIFYNDGSIPTTSAAADVIISAISSTNFFGYSLVSGDFNADGRTDLAVGATAYSSSAGRVYIFYNDGSIPTTAETADVIINGETTNNYFGSSLASGDLNNDGKNDLIVGATGFMSNRGKVYIYTSNESKFSGAAASDAFGSSLATGDFNADGKIDLAVGAYGYSTNTGRVYIFYNRGNVLSPSTTSADVVITGEVYSYFGYSMTSGDFNTDGKTDLAVGAYTYNSTMGRSYVFYNDGSIPTTAASADVVITGETMGDFFGYSMTSGDFNADGRVDLAIGACQYQTLVGRLYIFYNDGSIPTTAATADVKITGEVVLGRSLAAGDLNADGRTDLVSGASSSGGVVYIFYNDGAYPASASAADVKILGFSGVTGGYLGENIICGDFNADGKTDLAVGRRSSVAGVAGDVYIFYNDGAYPSSISNADVTIKGESANAYFSYSMAAGDFNADGKTDLVVGSKDNASNLGRTYIFYNKNGINTNLAANADVKIDGVIAGGYFGNAFAVGDFNNDSVSDLVVAAFGNGSVTGSVLVYPMEAGPTFQAPVSSRGTFQTRGNVKIQ